MEPADSEITQLQTAIAAFEAQRAVLGDAVVDAGLASMREKLAALQSRGEQQRKLVTVLFADVCGFTALSETLDPEVVTSIMNDLWGLADDAITAHGGRIDKHIGDAVMALWGADASREDDACAAVRGGLAMQAAVAAFGQAHQIPLAMRVGINTGSVLLGAVGSTGEFTAMGDAVNLASRLEHAAPRGGILISHDTYRHVRGVFDVQPQAPLAVRGKVEPVQTYVVEREKPRAFRPGTRGIEGVETRMIGRAAELLALQSAFVDAVDAPETRVMTVVGEAGVGKSRLLYEFENWLELRPEGIYYFKGRGTPNTQNIPNSLFRDAFAHRFEILDSDSPAAARAKFRRNMEAVLEPGQADVAGHWLGFDFSASEAVQPLLGAPGFAETARAFLTRYFRALAGADPVVIFLEDAQWADDPSLDLAAYLAAAIPEARLLIVALARPTFFERRPQWGEGQSAFRRIDLAALSRRCAFELVDEILQRVEDVPAALRDLIAGEAEGNPFYIEELVKMLIEQGVIVRGGAGEQGRGAEDLATDHWSPAPDRWTVRTDRLAAVQVPPTLTGLLQARLDSLPRPEREALQRASVIGRLFWDDALADLLQAEPAAIGATLAAIRERELIYKREHSSFAQAEEYIFRHIMLRDVAYETVLLKYRAEFHGRVARWLEAHAGERLEEYLSLIAEHYVAAGEGVKAATLLVKAGQEALQVGGWNAARLTLERALELFDAAGETNRAAAEAAVGLGWAYNRLGDYPAATAALERGLSSARAAGSASLQAEALIRLSRTVESRGEYEHAASLIADALAIARSGDERTLALGQSTAAGLAWVTGDLEAAEAYARAALETGRAAGDVVVEINALNMLGIVANSRRDFERNAQYLEATLALAREARHLSYEARALLNLGDAAYHRRDLDTARSYGRAALERYRELGEQETVVLVLFNLAQADLMLRDLAAARRSAREALALAVRLGYAPFVSATVALFGQILGKERDAARALALVGLARAQPVLEHQVRLEIEDELGRLQLPAAQVEAALAAGAALDLDTVVQEILDGKW